MLEKILGQANPLQMIDQQDAINEAVVLDESDYAEVDEATPEVQPISYSGTDFDVEGLVRRLNRGDIVIPTFGHSDPNVEVAGFQRAFVWRPAQMDKFIESLLLGFPVPGIVLVQQADKRYLVLDGQQRLSTLAAFYDGRRGNQLFALKTVAEEYQDLTYSTLSDAQRRSLDNTFIQAIIVKTDGSTNSLESIYQVFERLNSGGTQLTGHEIRVALYAGRLIDFIAGLNQLPSWRALYGKPSPRLRDQELILRILAFFVSPGTYKRPMKKFLNDFSGTNRDCANLDKAHIKGLLDRVCSLLNESAGPASLRHLSKQVNVAMTEAVIVGLMRRLEVGDSSPSPESVNQALIKLLDDKKFVESITEGTAVDDSVKYRLAFAAKIFGAL
ncbi:hypothetical protein FHW83_004727 [Duganella sp. SG902]|uniref:DUF262 domain-containing protein n=1 Tax=Duganella sp. SG902 TaxID=2587016 RepID=UPI00159E279E|nr:DUF262 domain-containing protein [Duganella sp. SG902]NVM78896.1 hypothetical protein [Duganella sp. SG902]